MKGISINLILDTRRKRKDNKYPIKLRVIYRRKSKDYRLNEYVTPKEWEKIKSGSVKAHLKGINSRIRKYQIRAEEVTERLSQFTFGLFEKDFNVASYNPKSVLDTMQSYIDDLRRHDRISTANSYLNALNSFKDYLKEKRGYIPSLYFQDITIDWLYEYEEWMLKRKRSLSTVGVYLRTMRIAFKIAIDGGNCSQSLYPFGKRKYQIPATKNLKRALPSSDIKNLIAYSPKSAQQEWAKDVWLFSYLCNGISITDIARLKIADIQFDKIVFTRKKTEFTTKSNQKPVIVPLLLEAREIISRHGNVTSDGDQYVFKILKPSMTMDAQIKRIKQETKNINKYLKEIQEVLEIDLNLTTYTARHSFATVLKRNGTSTEFISESLGHKNLKTTSNYLDSFENSYKLEIQKRLLEL